MKKLIDRHWDIQPAVGPIPYYNYKKNTECSIIESSNFKHMIDLYYPRNRVSIISELDDKVHYKVQPFGSIDELVVSHWDLWPLYTIVESNTFTGFKHLVSGAIFKNLDSGGVDISLGDGSSLIGKANPDDIVVIMVHPDHLMLSESLCEEVPVSGTGPSGVVGTGKNPEAAVPSKSVSGRETGIRRLGRANKEREEMSDLESKLELLLKKVPTRDEVQGALDKIQKKSIDPVRLKSVFDKLGDALT